MAKKFDLKLKGYVGGYDFDSNYVEYILEKSESKEVNVLIDSLGGSVASAFSICEAFRRHGNVKVHYVGMNASAATIASLGAKHISIATSGMYLVHKCSTVIAKWASLNADQLRQLIEEYDKQKKDMEKIDLNIAAMYADKCKKDKQALLDLMKVGGWLTAQEALDWGFVDEICDLPGDVTPKVTAQVIEDLSEAGIPLPFSVQERNDSRVDKIFSLFASFFRSNTQHQQSIVTMNKKFQSIIGCLEIEAIEESDGKFHLSADLMQKLDSHLQEMDSKIKELKEIISQKEIFRSGNVTQRKKFIFIILFLYSPSTLAGGKMKNGLRDKLAEVLGVNAQTTISNNRNNLVFSYQLYKYFRQDVDWIYGEMMERIKPEK